MEKTKDQILIEKLRKAGHRTRMGMRPPMDRPPMDMPPADRMPMGRAPMPMGPRPGIARPVPFEGEGPMRGRGPHGIAPHSPRGYGERRGPMEGRGSMRPMGPMGGALPRETLLLTVLEAGESGIRQKDISEAIGINASSLSEQIDRLEEARYLERRANPEDKRSTLIVLTEKGKARAYEVLDERQKAAADLFAKLSEEEKDTLISLLDKLLSE